MDKDSKLITEAYQDLSQKFMPKSWKDSKTAVQHEAKMLAPVVRERINTLSSKGFSGEEIREILKDAFGALLGNLL